MDYRRIVFVCTLLFSIALEIYVRAFGIFGLWPPIDNFMHFFWGLNIFLFVVLYLRWKPLDALLVVLAWQWIWEAGEILTDILITQPDFMLDPFFFDGIKDTIFDAAGGMLAWGILRIMPQKETQECQWRLHLILYSTAIVPLLVVGTFVSVVRESSAQWLAFCWILAAIPAVWAYLRFFAHRVPTSA